MIVSRTLRWAIPFMAAAAILTSASFASAQGMVDAAKAPAAAKDREALMKSNSDEAKVLAAVAKGEAPLDAKAVASAEKVNANAKVLLSKFPAGTSEDDVKGAYAKAIIWTEWSKFTELAGGFTKASEELVVAAKSGDQKAFAEKQAAVAQACGACHKPYRTPEKK